MNSIVVLAVFGLLAINSAYGFNCYQCVNCEALNSDIKATECKSDGLDTPGIPTIPTPTVPDASTTVATSDETSSTVVSSTDASDSTSSTTSSTTTSPEPAIRSKYDREGKADEKYKCFVRTVKFLDGELTQRGCTEKKECKAEGIITKCNLCDGDSCNPAAGIKSWAVGSIVLIALAKMFL